MPTDCNQQRDEFSLPHGGTAQTDRQPLALQPGYVQVDERTVADWIVFARNYARFLQYYNLSDTQDGDWTPFWTANPATVLANLAAAPIDDFREATRLVFIQLQKLDNQSDDQLLKQHINLLFDWITTLAWQLDRHVQRLPEHLPIKNSLRNRIVIQLAPALQKWIAWHKAAANTISPLFPLLDAGKTEISDRLRQMHILGASPIPTNSIYNAPPPDRQFSEDWLRNGATDWSTYSDTGIPADATIYGDPSTMTSVDQPINFALTHFFFTNVYEQFLQAFASAATEAAKALQQLLTNWNQHEPHFALFLAFLRSLQQEQVYLNTITDRHLRFYYERVLRLQLRPPQPARAHLLVELAKQSDNYLLPKGTELKAGKDAIGQDIIFATDEDFVANKATVVELRSLFKVPADPAEYRLGDQERPVFKNTDCNRYFAAPVANSVNGLGEEELTTSDGRWHPFGNRSVDAADNTWTVHMPRAEVGFALASHYLYLTQGNRTVTLEFTGNGLAVLNGKKFHLALTTEKGWYETEATATSAVSGNYQLQWTIAGNEPAILPYQAKLHGGAFPTGFPLLKAKLVHEDSAEFDYQALKNLTVTQLALTVEVTGKRDLSLSGATGPLDGSKPFYPFGAVPGNGAAFVVGDKEVFQKEDAEITLHLDWKEDYTNDSFYFESDGYTNPSTVFEQLVAGTWGSKEYISILPLSSNAIDATFTLQDGALIVPDFTSNLPFSNQMNQGFVRFKLVNDWSNANHAQALVSYMKGDRTSQPGRLFDPQIVSVALDYLATQTIPLHNAAAYLAQPGRLFHLHPFGFSEVQPTGSSIRLLPLLVPQYSVDTADGPVSTVGKDGGEWYIGISALNPPQVLSLLIQVANGSADPLLEKPADHVRWSYLSDNQWFEFATGEISDGTQGLLQTGLIRFNVPRPANNDNTLLPAHRYWLRAHVPQAVDAVGQIIGVHAQAVGATLVDNNDPQLSALPLLAGTIAKLRQPVSAVKKIVQPYATFGGTAAEMADRFNTRISERLRHKERAITQWDYERLILDNFPTIHKVKCLNHLRYEPNADQPIYRELAPGHVTVMSVSNLRNQNAVDPLRPYTSLADLQSIEAFLRKRTSCFVRLHVRNPVFEPVQARFRVRFFLGYEETFYKELLNEEIIRHLSPWAFEEGHDIEFGGKIYQAALINFVEERPYVDFVEDFTLRHETDPAQQGVELIRPTRQVSILVAARQHDITVISDAQAAEWTETCGCEIKPPLLQHPAFTKQTTRLR